MRTGVATLVIVLVGSLGGVARSDVGAAARAFSDGQAAQLEGDYDHAAQSFELAFSIAPSKEALRSAVRARQQAGQLARAATLAELLLAQYAADPQSATLAHDVITEAQPRFGRLTVACSAPCSLAIDGRAISVGVSVKHIAFVTPGKLALRITFEGDLAVSRDATLGAGETLGVEVEKPAARATSEPAAVVDTRPPPLHTSNGLPHAVTFVGAVVTVGLAGAGIWSGVDTNKAHDAYVANPTHAAYDTGRSKQLRTNILFGSAAGVGLVTGVIAMVWTHWHGDHGEAPTVSASPTVGGMTFAFGSQF